MSNKIFTGKRDGVFTIIIYEVDGIILCSLENPWEDVEPYLQHGPIVLCNEYIEEANIPTVKFDHAQGHTYCKHVLEQGYRNLIFAVVTKPKWLANREKWAFYVQ